MWETCQLTCQLIFTLKLDTGLVFLQYRSETKRALLPNEITSIDTVRALFVRSFPRQLSMLYLEGPNVKIYIHDSSKDMFYELEDCRWERERADLLPMKKLFCHFSSCHSTDTGWWRHLADIVTWNFNLWLHRSHLREIRDRSVLRLFESNEVAAPQMVAGVGMPQSISHPTGQWDQDMVGCSNMNTWCFFSHIFQIESFQPRSKKKSKCQSNRFFISSTHIFSSDRLISCRATSASLNSIRSFNISIFIRAKWVFFASFFNLFYWNETPNKKTQKLEEVWNERFHEVKLIEFLISIVFFFLLISFTNVHNLLNEKKEFA